MLGKLLKYDFKAGSQIMITIIISMAVFLGLSLILISFNSQILNSLIYIISTFASIGLFGAFAIIRILYFYNTMTKNESYFTFSIPSSVNKIVFSKIFTSFIWGLICILCLLTYWTVLFKFTGSLNNVIEVFDNMINFAVFVILFQFLFITILIAFSISLSIYSKFKNNINGVIISIISYVLLSNACGIIQLIVLAISQFFQGNLFKIMNNEIVEDSLIKLFNSSIISISTIYFIAAMLLYFLTVKIFSKYKSI